MSVAWTARSNAALPRASGGTRLRAAALWSCIVACLGMGCADSHGLSDAASREGGDAVDVCDGSDRLGACCSDECVWLEPIERCVQRSRVCIAQPGGVIGPCDLDGCAHLERYFGGPYAACDGMSHDLEILAGVCR